MNFRQAWRISKVPYVEVTYRSTQLTRGGAGQRAAFSQDPRRQVAATIRSSRISKVIFAVFICVGASVPFFDYSATPVTLASSVVFSLAITLAYVILYSLQVLPSFSSSEPFALLSTLPFSDGDFSLVAMLSFLRTFDYLVVGAVTTQVVGVALITGSAAAALLMLVASLINVTFAIAVALWLSGLFYRNITRGGKSKGASLTRMVFLVTWGLAAMSIGFMFSLIGYLLPAIDSVLSGNLSHSAVGVLLAFLHPFPIGLLVASAVYSQFLATATSGLVGGSALVFASVVVYVALAFAAGRRTLHAIVSVAHGQTVGVVRQVAKEFLLKTRRPILAYVTKDLRIASKAPSMAFIFALPVFEMLIVGLNTSAFSFLRASSVISATLLGCFFTLFSSSVLLNTEGVGLDYTMSLPLGPAVIIDAKALVATATYLPVPVIIAALLAARGTTAGILVLIPFVEILAVAAAAMAQLTFFIRGYVQRISGGEAKQERQKSAFQPTGFSLMAGRDLLRLGEALLVAALVIGAPLGVYAATFFVTGGHIYAIGTMVIAAVAELLGVRALVGRL